MNILKLLNSKDRYKNLYESNEVYEVGDLVRIVAMKEIVYNNQYRQSSLELGTVCRIVETRSRSTVRCYGDYCNFSSRSQCLKMKDINSDDGTWTCYVVVERVE